MKNIYKYAISFLLIFGSVIAGNTQEKSSQEYKVALSSGTLVLQDINEVEVIGYNGSEVVISAILKNNKRAQRAQGLRVLNSMGLDDNTGFGIAVEKDGNTVTATQISNECECKNIQIKVPNGVNLSVSHGSHDAEDIVVKDFSSELEITTNYHDIHLENVTGPMAVKTVYGTIEGTFTSLSQKGSVTIYSVYDLVDITIPTNAKANVTLSAPYGNVYSNAAVQVSKSSSGKKSCNSGGGKTIEGSLNGGGVDFSVKSAYEDIYLRQK